MSVNIYNKTEDKLVPVAGATVYADNPIGSIVPYGGSQPPSGWLICDGRSLSKSNYFDLFKIIGYNFGGSDSTFNLPNITQLKQDYTVKSQLDTWTSNLENGSESHIITIDNDGSYYFEIVLSNASLGKQANNISITFDNGRLVSSWGYIGVGAQLVNKTIFLKKGTYTITHICQTTGIGGTSVVTVYSTRNEPVGSYIIKAKHTPVPADFSESLIGYLGEETNYNLYQWSSTRKAKSDPATYLDFVVEQDGWYSIDYTLKQTGDNANSFTIRDFDKQGETHAIGRAEIAGCTYYRSDIIVPLKAGTYRYLHSGVGTLSVYMNRRDFA